jgi:hypothetical protein
MKELLELRKLFNRNKIRQLEILGHPIHPDMPPSRFQVMYKALVNGEVQTDEQAADLLGLDSQDRAFRRFKLDFRRRLYTTLLFLDTDNTEVFNATQKASFYCWRRTALMETLWQRRCYENARVVAEEMIEVALKYDQVTVVMEISKVLKRYYSQYNPNRERYKFYLELNKKYTTFWLAENKARMCYEQMVMPFVKSKSSQLNVADLGEAYLKELRPLASFCDTQIFLGLYFTIEIMVPMIRFNWEEALKLCEYSEERFKEKGEVSNRIMNAIWTNKAICLMMLRAYELAIELIKLKLSKSVSGSSPWFRSMELMVIVAIKSEQYSLAWKSINEISEAPQFLTTPSNLKESWQILFAYLVVLVLKSEFEIPLEDNDKIKNFRLGKFLNEVPERSKDKKGLNVTILILQIQYLLFQGDFEKIEMRTESLRKYQSRYLSTEVGYYRTNIFIKILCGLIPSKFRKESFLKKTKLLFEYLQKTSPTFSQERHEIEVIPYEKQYQWIVDALD